MSIEVTEATEDDLKNWNKYVDQSPHGDLFHYREALETQAEFLDCKLHTLIGFKGQEPVGIFPLFTVRKGPVTTAFSPPPEVKIPYQGPALLNMEKLKQRKAERRHQSFLQECLSWMDSNFNPRYTHIRLHCQYQDLRPLKWEGFDVTPAYTYLLDIDREPEELLMSFSSDARSNIRDGRDAAGVSVSEEGRESICKILEQVRQRYESQGIAFHLPRELLLTLYDELPAGAIRPYVCRVDGEFAGGILAYEHHDTIYRWQGGVRTDTDTDVSVNDLLDWTVMQSAQERSLSSYDLVGANNSRINKYKAKFNPDLQEFYTLERASTAMNIAAHLYKQFRSSTGLTPK